MTQTPNNPEYGQKSTHCIELSWGKGEILLSQRNATAKQTFTRPSLSSIMIRLGWSSASRSLSCKEMQENWARKLLGKAAQLDFCLHILRTQCRKLSRVSPQISTLALSFRHLLA